MRNCYRHGAYNGSECETCVILRAQAEQTSAIEEEAARNRLQQDEIAARQEQLRWRLAEQAAVENERLARDGWKLEAASRVKRAQQLYKVGLRDDAYTVVAEALKADPANAEGHVLAVRICRSKGDSTRVREHFEKAVRLIGSDEYGERVWFKLLAAVAADECSPEDVRSLTEKLLKRFQVMDTETLALYATSAMLKPWALSVAQRVTTATDAELRGLVGHDGLPLARIVAETMMMNGDTKAAGAMWVHGAAWYAELSKEGTGLGPPGLADANVESRRAFFAAAAAEIAAIRGSFDDRTQANVLRCLQDSYNGNRSYFYEHITSCAVAAATPKTGQQGLLLGCVIVFGVLVALGMALNIVTAVSQAAFGENTTAAGLGIVVGMVSALVAIVWFAILVSKHMARQSRERYQQYYYQTWNELAARQKVLESSLGIS
jgi:hypothetical protein